MDKMNKVSFTLELTNEELQCLYEKAAIGGLTPDDLLENFVNDLIAGTRANGPDECMYAQQWYDRCWFGMFPEQTLLKYLIEESSIDDLMQQYTEMKQSEINISRAQECLKTGVAKSPSGEVYTWRDVVNDDQTPAYLTKDEWQSEIRSDIENEIYVMNGCRENIESMWDNFLAWTNLPVDTLDRDEEIMKIIAWQNEILQHRVEKDNLEKSVEKQLIL